MMRVHVEAFRSTSRGYTISLTRGFTCTQTDNGDNPFLSGHFRTRADRGTDPRHILCRTGP